MIKLIKVFFLSFCTGLFSNAQPVPSPDTVLFVEDSIRPVGDSVHLGQTISPSGLKEPSEGFPVVLRMDTLFLLYAPLGEIGVAERANLLKNKLSRLMLSKQLEAEKLYLEETSLGQMIVYDTISLVTITSQDALGYGRTEMETAESYMDIIDRVVVSPRVDRDLWTTLSRIGLIILTILSIVVLINIINYLHRRGQEIVHQRLRNRISTIGFKNVELLPADQQVSFLSLLLKILKIIAIVFTIYITIPILFSIFPETKYLSDQLFGYVLDPFSRIGSGILNFIPNLIAISIIILVTVYVIKLVGIIYVEIEQGRLVLPGFYTDWARTTYNIIRICLYIFMFIIIYPYLPGSDSLIFQSVLVFIGVLLALGSTNAVGNLVSGIVITYMRPFKPGDRVLINGVTGIVRGRNLLVTRLRSDNNEDITIPNSAVMKGATRNYSSSAQKLGLLINICISVHYSDDLEKISKILIDAALKTEGISANPQPVVVNKDILGESLVLEVKGHLKDAKQMEIVRSRMLQEIVRKLNTEGIKLLS